jgi:hypothetical protein
MYAHAAEPGDELIRVAFVPHADETKFELLAVNLAP